MSSKHYLTQPRQPKGVPVGGEWTARELSEAEVSLLSVHRESLMADPTKAEIVNKRRAQLETHGYVPAAISAAVASPKTTARIDDWWDQEFLTAEYTTDDVAVPQMPQDYTPGRTAGRSITGRRRTHRMRYEIGAGVTVRMPSRTAINRFMNESGSDTVDVPVAAEAPGAPAIQGWVRITRLAPGKFSAEGLGMNGKTEVIVAESVSAAMEGRSAQRSLNSYADMVARRQERIAAMGLESTQVASSWIEGVAYDEKNGIMYSNMASGRSYAHRVQKETYQKLVNATSPGAVFNKEIKGKAERVDLVDRCDKCGRFMAVSAPQHICPKEQQKTDQIRSNRLAAAYVGLVTPKAAPTTKPAPAKHVVAEDEQTVDVARIWRDAAAKPADGKPMFGPRGFTAQAAQVIAPNTSSTYNPYSYGSFGGTPYANDGNLVRFSGVQAHQAERLQALLGEHDHLDERQNYGPTTRTLLKAAIEEPGTIELSGYAVTPSRRDERVTFEAIDIYDEKLADRLDGISEDLPDWPSDEEDAEEAAVHERKLHHLVNQVCEKYGLDNLEAPDEVSVKENPWRPGERAVRLWWD